MNHDDDMKKLGEALMLEHSGKWYSWDSPIGLSIFLLVIPVIILLIRLAFII